MPRRKKVELRDCPCGKKVPYSFRFCPWCRYKPYRLPSPDEEVLKQLEEIILSVKGDLPSIPCSVPHDKLKDKAKVSYCPDCGQGL
jgi:hypothetical protein